MRLIDADKLINQIEQHCIDDEVTCKDDVIEIIDNAPTVEERQSGRWKELIDEKWEGTTIYCPYCNENALEKYRDGLCRQVKSNYCPNCGAKMEET
ncbi:MAG: hypothetical protein IIY21_16085 [Clostridiales bacterium]|nr:hypothetical protein [Clostridiales bacterium]